MEIVISEYTLYREEEVLKLYRSVGWSAYYAQPDVLQQAFANSLCILVAFADGELAGLIRAVGDGQTVVFVQDILVAPAYQRKGIGTQLMAQLLERYRHVRQLHLLTDDLPETVAFYKAVGFSSVEELHFRAFTRQRF